MDRLDMAGLRRLVGSISRCLAGLWRKLGVASALAEVLGRRRFTTNGGLLHESR